MRLIDGKKMQRMHITAQNLEKYAGVPRFYREEAALENTVDVTGARLDRGGGELLHIEGLTLPGKGKMTATGKWCPLSQSKIDRDMS